MYGPGRKQSAECPTRKRLLGDLTGGRGQIDTCLRQRGQPVRPELRPVGRAVTGGGYAGAGIALRVEGCMPVTDDVRCAR